MRAITSPTGIYNIGTGIETSVNQLIEVLKEVSGRDFPVLYNAPREGEVRRIALSYKRASEILGWKPNVSLKDGIRETFQYFANIKD
ncbi:MAG: hypothetical protein ACP5RW_05855 [bacterium]